MRREIRQGSARGKRDSARKTRGRTGANRTQNASARKPKAIAVRRGSSRNRATSSGKRNTSASSTPATMKFLIGAAGGALILVVIAIIALSSNPDTSTNMTPKPVDDSGKHVTSRPTGQKKKYDPNAPVENFFTSAGSRWRPSIPKWIKDNASDDDPADPDSIQSIDLSHSGESGWRAMSDQYKQDGQLKRAAITLAMLAYQINERGDAERENDIKLRLYEQARDACCDARDLAEKAPNGKRLTAYLDRQASIIIKKYNNCFNGVKINIRDELNLH